MPYMLMILEPAGQRLTRTRAEGEALYERMLHFGDGLKARGLLLSGESLETDTGGVRVAVRDGQRQLRDGPFAEAKEMIGGFFLINCATRDEALAVAAQCPAAEWATIEVRAVAPCFE